ncbi:MAG: Tic22 family protein [Cyanobacteria bacterium P01_D01_bin.73]
MNNQREWSRTALKSRLGRWSQRCLGGLVATAGGALMLLGSSGSLSAIALTEDELKARLAVVPVFSVFRSEDGSPLTIQSEGEGQSAPTSVLPGFLDPDDVRAVLNQVREQNGGGDFDIRALSLARLYEWSLTNAETPDAPRIQYFPIGDQLPQALELRRAANPDRNIERFSGIPLFVALDQGGESYLIVKDERSGKEHIPFFFRVEDLNASWARFLQKPEGSDLSGDLQLEVRTLGEIVGVLRSENEEAGKLANLIQLIPSKEAFEYAVDLESGDSASQGGAASGAGALAP